MALRWAAHDQDISLSSLKRTAFGYSQEPDRSVVCQFVSHDPPRCSVFPKVESYMINVFIFSPSSHALHERSSEFSPQDIDTSLVFSSHHHIPLWNVIRGRHEVITNEYFGLTSASHFRRERFEPLLFMGAILRLLACLGASRSWTGSRRRSNQQAAKRLHWSDGLAQHHSSQRHRHDRLKGGERRGGGRANAFEPGEEGHKCDDS